MNKLAILVPAALLVAACSGAGGGASDMAAPADAPVAGGAAARSEANPSPLGSLTSADAVRGPANTAAGGTAKRAVVEQRAIISTGRLEVTVKDVDRSRLAVLNVVDGMDGLVADEQATADRRGRTDALRMVLRIPSDQFETAVAELGKLGKVISRSTSSKDVTTEVIDNDVRIRAQEKSLRRIEQLLAAAKNIGQIMSIEAQLTERQQELDSLKSQKAYLDDQTSLSTVTIFLHHPAKHVTHEPKKDDTGFLAGFRSGLDGLQEVTVGLLTVVGALLPFGLVALVVGWPAWLLLRRSRHPLPR